MPTVDGPTTGQNQKEVTVSAGFIAMGVAGSFGYRASTTNFPSFGIYGGQIYVDGARVSVANTTLTISDGATNYISLTRSGTFVVNTTGHPAGNIPLWEVVTSGGGISSMFDMRTLYRIESRLSKVVTTADVTLTMPEATATSIIATGTLTGNRALIVPTQVGLYQVHNTCAGAFTLTVKTAAGSGVVIPPQRRMWVMCDGTNVVPVHNVSNTQDIAYAAAITPDLSLGTNIVVGALTGNLTINAPTNVVKGETLDIALVQDATGGRTITWDAVFKKAADGAGSANQKASTSFMFDGTHWIQRGGALAWLT